MRLPRPDAELCLRPPARDQRCGGALHPHPQGAGRVGPDFPQCRGGSRRGPGLRRALQRALAAGEECLPQPCSDQARMVRRTRPNQGGRIAGSCVQKTPGGTNGIAALTGESVPVTKRCVNSSSDEADVDAEPGGENTPHLFSGTLVVRGQGVARIVRTGAATRLGRIGVSLAAIESEPTLLQQNTARLIAKLGMMAFAFCALVVVAYGLLRGDWVEGTLAGITLAIALLPEEFPMVLAIFLSLGAWRLARHKVLARRGAVIETLGAATRLCVDKTGTLTENRMQVAVLWCESAGEHEPDANHDRPLPAPFAHLVEIAALASAPRPVDPMDRAVRAVALDGGQSGAPLGTHPLRPDRLAFVQVWPEAEGAVLFAAKGAPEAIFGLCRLDEPTQAKLSVVVSDLAARGLRVLGVASCR